MRESDILDKMMANGKYDIFSYQKDEFDAAMRLVEYGHAYVLSAGPLHLNPGDKHPTAIAVTLKATGEKYELK